MPKMTQDVADKAAAIGESYNAKIGAVTGDPRLTAEAKRSDAAKVYVDHKQQMDALKSSFDGGAQAAATNAARTLFGNTSVSGADAISVRDASDRAAQLEDARQASDLYQRAVNNGDDHLVKAVAQKAYEMTQQPLAGREWGDLLQQHADANPGFAEQLNAMHDDSSLSDNFMNAGHFILFPPPILAHLAEHHINALAQKGDN